MRIENIRDTDNISVSPDYIFKNFAWPGLRIITEYDVKLCSWMEKLPNVNSKTIHRKHEQCFGASTVSVTSLSKVELPKAQNAPPNDRY